MKRKSRSSLVKGLVLLSIGVLLAGVYLWWHNIYSNPERAFWGSLNHALETSAYGTRVTQSQADQAMNQRILVQLTGKPAAQAQTLVSQGGGSTKVLTEAIGTPYEDFARYILISTDQKGANGKPLDFSKVLNQWGKESGDRSATNGQLYNQTVLGVVPFGNLTPAQRAELMPLMKETYQISLSDVKKTVTNGRPSYTYDVKVLPQAYVAMLKKYASLVGLTQFETIDPATYASGDPVAVTITLDVWSRQLTKLAYQNSNRQELLTSNGIQLPAIAVPTHTTSIEALQTQLQKVQ